MYEPHDPSHAPRGVSVAEAARLLNIAPSTVRRHIREGALDAIRELRPQGSAWRVLLPGGTSDGASEHRPRAGAGTRDGGVNAPDQQGGHAPTRAMPRATEHPATSHAPLDLSVLVALIGELTTARTVADQRAETVERLAGEVANLREERGRLSAELERAASALVTAQGALTVQERHSRLLHVVLAVLVLVGGTLMIVAAIASVWVWP